MEEQLREIANNTERTNNTRTNGSSHYILVSEKNARIRTRFSPSLELKANKKYKMAVVGLETYYSFPNIEATNNSFRYSPNNGTAWFNVTIPEGCYEITDINEQVPRVMKAAGYYNVETDDHNITIEANNNTLKTVLRIAEDYVVDFTTPNSLRTVLGFNDRRYLSGYNESENIVDIMSITSLRVTCDIIGASYTSGTTGNMIYSFFPNVGPGYKIVKEPVNLVFLPITLSTISSMETTLTNQNGILG